MPQIFLICNTAFHLRLEAQEVGADVTGLAVDFNERPVRTLVEHGHLRAHLVGSQHGAAQARALAEVDDGVSVRVVQRRALRRRRDLHVLGHHVAVLAVHLDFVPGRTLLEDLNLGAILI